MALFASLMLATQSLQAQTGDIEFHYLFARNRPEADAGPQNHTLILGGQVEVVKDPGAHSRTGIKVSPSLRGRVYFEDTDGDGAAILNRLASSEWTLELWIKLDEFSERRQMLFVVQPMKDSHSDFTIRLAPEKSSANAGAVQLTDSTGVVLAQTPVLEWRLGVWYYLAVASTPTEGRRLYTFHRGDESSPSPEEVYSGSGKSIVPLVVEAPRLYNFANFWGNLGQDALRGTMANIRLSWRAKTQEEVSQSFQEARTQ